MWKTLDCPIESVLTLTQESSLVAQMVKRVPTMRETGVQSLSWEDLLEKEMTTHSSILAWKIPWTGAFQAPLSMGFPRQEYWGRLPFPSPGDLPDPGIEPASPALAGRVFTAEPPGKSIRNLKKSEMKPKF